jgi:ribonuclease T2
MPGPSTVFGQSSDSLLHPPSHEPISLLTFPPRPDNCDGTWEEYCDKDREYSNITAILEGADTSVLSYMEENWKDYQGDDESFWAHEWNKHGTCMSPLEPKCYPDFQPTDEVVDYFRKTVALHKTLPSYTWLEEAGIVPSSSTTYTLAAIQAAIKKHHGFEVIVNCRSGELNEFWYHYNVQGSVQTGKYIPVPPVGSPSNCPKTGIKYLPKSSSGAPTTTRATTTAGVTSTTTGSGPGPTGAPGVLDGPGRWLVSTGAAASGGFLVSGGTWYRGGGTPATFTATPDAKGGFSLRTSKGKCVIQTDASLFCDTSVANGSSLGYDGTYLTYAGSNTFYASALPSGTAQGTVYTTSKAVSFKAAWTAL